MARLALITLLLLPTPGWTQFPGDLQDALADAVDLHRRSRAERYRVATDPNERHETLIGPVMFDRNPFDALFTLGDEAFESELDRSAGLGQGDAFGPAPAPARGRRLHDGERGGLDASSCRSCHFVGGPDGSGRLSQLALLRGDGRHLSESVQRDAPHVMGLGYIARAARETEAELDRRRRIALEQAADTEGPIRTRLLIGSRDFGYLTALPDGTLVTDELRGISADLRIRPFGHKGRHADLVSLSDEALQIHLGIQTDSRVSAYADDASHWLGEGGPYDRDDDGAQAEATSAQAVLLSAYLSVLPVPQIRPPDDPRLLFVWARGYRAFETVGCAACHVPELRIRALNTTLVAADESFDYAIDLAANGESPRPARVDFGADEMDSIPSGTPIYAFTDLQRHDLGPELAEPLPEILPDGAGEVPGSVWLTRSLWGLADTAPYLHDGRAPTVEDAIVAHGGDAAPSRAAYLALDDEERAALRVFLASLTRDPVLLVE